MAEPRRTRLTLPSGRERWLSAGETTILGRKDAPAVLACFVSREQAAVTVSEDGCTVTCESLSDTNHTHIAFAPGPSFHIGGSQKGQKLVRGEKCSLADGDGIGLTGGKKEGMVRVCMEDDTRPAKRRRPVGSAPAAASEAAMDEPASCTPPATAQSTAPSAHAPAGSTAPATASSVPTATQPSAPVGACADASEECAPAAPAPSAPAAVEFTKLSKIKPCSLRWSVHHDELLVMRAQEQPALAAGEAVALACFDLDNTLLRWASHVRFPSAVEHYELPSVVVERLRALHAQGHQLCVFSNQGGIKTAFAGKTAARVKDVIARLATALSPAPLVMLAATGKKGSRYRKPDGGMFEYVERACLGGRPVDKARSFYVGDAAGRAGDFDSVDKEFASKAGLRFETPESFFGGFGAAAESVGGGWGAFSAEGGAPSSALAGDAGELWRVAELRAGHAAGPIVLLLCGAPGSGKSTFCERLQRHATLSGGDGDGAAEAMPWRVVCQDTAPGRKREAVEAAALAALADGHNVVVDRTHLTPEQRAHFVRLGRQARAAVHVAVLRTEAAVCKQRVLERTEHPAGVQGVHGIPILQRMQRDFVLPEASAEGIDVVTLCAEPEQVDSLAQLYARGVLRSAPAGGQPSARAHGFGPSRALELRARGAARARVDMPPFGLGTFELSQAAVRAHLAQCLAACEATAPGRAVLLDTAPTYKNGAAVRAVLSAFGRDRAFVCGKVPLAVAEGAAVRPSVRASLDELGVERLDLLLLHWPSAAVDAGTLGDVWGAMEEAVRDGLARAVGVCNFTPRALELLPSLPSVVQVERHPLWPQWELLAFCALRGIVLMAHMPLGGRAGAAELLHHPVVQRVSDECALTPAQVLLRWNLQHGCAVVTRASGSHGAENARGVAQPLGAEQMRALDGMGRTQQKRFLTPTMVRHMSRPGAAYSWA